MEKLKEVCANFENVLEKLSDVRSEIYKLQNETTDGIFVKSFSIDEFTEKYNRHFDRTKMFLEVEENPNYDILREILEKFTDEINEYITKHKNNNLTDDENKDILNHYKFEQKSLAEVMVEYIDNFDTDVIENVLKFYIDNTYTNLGKTINELVEKRAEEIYNERKQQEFEESDFVDF